MANDKYVPFMLDNEEDFITQCVMSGKDVLTKYICTGCNKPFFVGECGNTV